MEKEAKTLQQKENKRTYKVPNTLWYKFLLSTVVPVATGRLYNYHVTKKDDIKNEKGAAFLIYNHQSRADYIWLAKAVAPRKINFMVNYAEFFRSHLHFILHSLHAIPKKMFTLDMASMRAVDSLVKQNALIAFAPEGTSSICGHNQPIVSGTGKYFQHYNIPVYIEKIRGGFLSNHKCCLDNRKGRVEAEFSLLFTPEQLQSMTPEEIELKINQELWCDDYEWQKEKHIKWKTNGRICTAMHDLCYKCPKCGKEFSMLGEGNELKCLECGNGASMDDYYEFHPFNEECVIPESPSKWFDWERRLVAKEIKDENFSFRFKTTIGIQPGDHYVKNKYESSEVVGNGEVIIDHEGFHFIGTKDNEEFKFDLSYKILNTISINTDCKMFAVFYTGVYYEFKPELPVVGKALLVVEEMSRLHVNSWPNFPWFDYEEEFKKI